ncbi:MAG TPA: peptidoglycan DD-metalloendopeptidase family protein [Candidatus Acidoferrum sp.]|nr:peptidoglycan DD-metalloendopeptidase family protein [Candidatus Acidoferrum sp.]
MGNKKLIRNIAVMLAVLFVLAALAPVVIQAFAADNGSISDLEKQLDALAKEQAALEKEIKNTKNSKQTELTKKTQFEKQVNTLTSKIELMDNMIGEYSRQIAEKERESNDVQADIDSQTGLYLLRMQETQMTGKLSFLDVVFGAASFSDLLTRLDNAAAIAAYDENLITSLRASKQAILDVKATIEQDKTKQEALRAEAEADKTSLQQATKDTEAYIAELDSDIIRKQKLYKEAEAEEERLNEELKELLRALAPSDYIGGNMIWPTPGYKKISCPFGMRTHPITGVYKMHTGIDIAAAGGTQILAAASGTVLKTGYSSAWGNYILLDHGGGIATFYAHMKTSALVAVGATVTKGQKIGIVGTTGLSTGNHLHFEVRVDGDSVQPLNYVTPT